jgi:glutaconate CoA-transferase subunit B
MTQASAFENLLFTGASQVQNDGVVFVGFHWPMLMARIARRLHAPNVTIVYENGIVEDRLTPIFPTSPCDLAAAFDATVCAGSLEALYMWLGSGRVTMTMLEAPIVDRHGNVNTSAVGLYRHPTVRLPGSGGGTELASLGRNLLLISASTKNRSYPANVDYVTSPGYLDGRESRQRLGYGQDTGPQTLVNPHGIFKFDDEGQMFCSALHPGVSVEAVRGSFDWPIPFADKVSALPSPSPTDLTVIREEIANARLRAYAMPE